jgi:hypothetical protein
VRDGVVAGGAVDNNIVAGGGQAGDVGVIEPIRGLVPQAVGVYSPTNGGQEQTVFEKLHLESSERMAAHTT